MFLYINNLSEFQSDGMKCWYALHVVEKILKVIEMDSVMLTDYNELRNTNIVHLDQLWNLPK